MTPHAARRVYSLRAIRDDFRQEFLAFAVARDVLRFGEFVTKAGRRTPYFFNAGLFNDGDEPAAAGRLLRRGAARLRHRRSTSCSARPTRASPLAAATAIALAEKGHNVPFSFNRKEAKDHGEGGTHRRRAARGARR